MARKKNGYAINIYFPKSEDKLIEIRKRMGISYIKFVQTYIMNLQIEDEQKNNVYLRIIKILQKRSKVKNI